MRVKSFAVASGLLFMAQTAIIATSGCALAGAGTEKARVYPAPQGEPLSKDFSVSVEGKDAPVYLARVMGISVEERRTKKTTEEDTALTSFASFDMNAPVALAVTVPTPVKSAVVLPSSSGIKPLVEGSKVSFQISKPGQYVLEVDGNWVNSLQIFANPFETDVPSPDDPNVIYYGPGVHNVESVEVGSGKTLYVAGGAVIYGNYTKGSSKGGPIVSVKGEGVTIRGRGVIDGSKCPFRTRAIMNIKGKDVKIEGVTVRDSGTWTMPIHASDNVKVENLKLFGWRGNSDGIDICGSRDVEVNSCYLRTWDDLVVVKTGSLAEGEARNIHVSKCVLWNELAHCLSIGAELRKNVEHVVFEDCDVVRDKGRETALRVYHCDSATIKDVVFKDIRFDECQRFLSLWIGKAVWSKDNERGHVEDILFKNLHANGSNLVVELNGFDETHSIKNVKFEDVTVNGKPLSKDLVKQNKFVENVSYAP